MGILDSQLFQVETIKNNELLQICTRMTDTCQWPNSICNNRIEFHKRTMAYIFDPKTEVWTGSSESIKYLCNHREYPVYRLGFSVSTNSVQTGISVFACVNGKAKVPRATLLSTRERNDDLCDALHCE
jgi:hypothetical protein